MSDLFKPEVDDLQTTTPVRPAAAAPVHGAASSEAGQSPGSSTKDVAAEEAKSVAGDATSSGRQVAETAKDQAGDVVDEARAQAREVYAQAKEELTSQAAAQHRRAGDGLHALADELRAMVQGTPHGGIATDLADQAASRVSGLAGWFDDHEPGDALDELRSVARRRPGAFLAGAAILGLVAGRLTRGGVDEARDDGPEAGSSEGSAYPAQPAYRSEPVPQTPPLVVESDAGHAPLTPGVGLLVDDPYDAVSTQDRPS